MNGEVLRVYYHKVKEMDYIDRTLKRLNQELSPLKDESTRDPSYVRNMWQEYIKVDNFNKSSSKKALREDEQGVHAYLKSMEFGTDHPDSKLLQELAEGAVAKDDSKVKEYYIRKF